MTYHLGRSLMLGFRDGFVIIGAMYMVLTTYDLSNGTHSIRPTSDDYILFAMLWGLVFVLRALFGRHPELPAPKGVITRYFSTAAAPAPAGPYSQALSRGGTVALAGQVGVDPESGVLAEGIAAQTQRALSNLMAVAKAASVGPGQILHVRVYLADKDDWAAMNGAYEQFWKDARVTQFSSGDYMFPARTTVQVGLPEGMLIEVEALAVRSA